MNNIKKQNLIVLIILGVVTLATLGITISQRMKIEKDVDSVAMIFDYDKLLEIEDYEKTSMADWLDVATGGEEEKYTIAVKEEYLSGFVKDSGIYYATVSETKNSLASAVIDEQILDLLQALDDETILIKTTKESDKEYLENAFSFYDFLNVATYDVDGEYYFIVEHGFNDASELDELPLGFNPQEVQDVKETGAKLCLRPMNYDHDPEGAFNLFVEQAEQYGMDSNIVFFQNEVVGYDPNDPESIDLAANYLIDNNLTFQLVESAELNSNSMLDGYEELIDEIGIDHAIRMFNVWDYIATKYQYLGLYKGPEEIENTIYRAVSERNNRAVVLNIIRNSTDTQYITDPLIYNDMLTGLESRLETQGLHYGNPVAFPEYHVSTGLLYAMAIELVLFVVILLNMIFGALGNKANIILTCIGVVGVLALDVISRNFFINVMSLASGITLSTIAVLFFVKYVLCIDEDARNKKTYMLIINAFITILIALIGGLLIASFESRIEFFLVLTTFKGVKLSLLTPIVLLVFSLFIYFLKILAKENKVSIKDQLVTTITTFLNVNIKMYYVIIFALVAMVGVLYLIRTGNSGGNPSSIEFLIRNFFENHLYARPRNKELFAAVPMMVVGIVFLKSELVQKNIYTRFIYVSAFAMCTIIETTSIINTFSHRTPVDMSLYRTFAAVFIGIIIGLIYSAIAYVFILIIKKINEKYKLVGY